ncbi:hypothetical protein CBS101457_005407 [Exobasidium rhododendri]|nr:hypothetical protein CBS101457_005407 [Exobasidium rhododendri]
MLSIRLSALLSVAYLSTVSVLSKPYAPDLYSRSELENAGMQHMKRQIAGARPYAPHLFSRSEVDEPETSSQLIKRSPMPTPALQSTSWSPLEFLGLREFSEEELHARGRVEDHIIEKRGSCSSDNACGSNQYCSSTKNRCYQKLNNGSHCLRDGACSTGYCCETSSKCEVTRINGAKCHNNDGACDSGYCSVTNSLCAKKGGANDSCYVDGGCKNGFSCVNKTCTKNADPGSHNHNPHKPSPHKPSPSGSPQHKRVLQHL